MFEHRLGSLLGKSVGEVRALPYPEYRRWQLFYLLEPWGWQNDEYYAALNTAMLYNINRGKASAKEPSEFMRDMAGEILKQLEEPPDLDAMSLEEKREYIIQQVKKDFGIK